MEFNLRKFDMNILRERVRLDPDPKITKAPVIVLLGKTDTGKSFLVRDILYNLQSDFPIGTVICPTEVLNEMYQQLIPSRLIKDKYNPEIVQNVIRRQHEVVQQRNQVNPSVDPRAFLILDDCLYDKTWTKEESTRFLFMMGRHVHLTTMITMQYPLGVLPDLRGNISIVFILRENILANRLRIYDNYAGMFPTFKFFCEFMDSCTENYECLVICNFVKSNKLEDQVFWYKAEAHPSFHMCAPSLWEGNAPLTSTLLRGNEYNPGAVRKNTSIYVRKQDDKM